MADSLNHTSKAPVCIRALTVIAVLIVTMAALSFSNNSFDADTPNDSIPVSSAADLARIGTDVDLNGYIWTLDASYHLTQDIILTGTNNHIPIGQTTPFSGIFDGRGHVISESI